MLQTVCGRWWVLFLRGLCAIALGVTALFSVILSVRCLWHLRRGQPGSVAPTPVAAGGE